MEQMCNQQHFATKGGLNPKTKFLAGKLFYFGPVLNKLMRLKRVANGGLGVTASSRWAIFVICGKKIAILTPF